MMKYLNKVSNYVVKLMNPLLKQLEKPMVMGMVTLFIVLYGALAKPQLPETVKNLMKSPVFRLLYIFLIAYTGDKNLIVSIVVAFTFMVLFGLLSEYEIQESFENTSTGDITENLEKELDALLDDLNTATEGSVEAVESEQPMNEGE